jgi:hypothetical protein
MKKILLIDVDSKIPNLALMKISTYFKSFDYKVKEVKGKRIKYHRWVVEQFIGRKLTSDEVVHHKDGNIFNNDISNLEILTLQNHTSLHITGTNRKGHKPHNKLNPYKIKRIFELHSKGWSYSKIALQLNISDNVVRNYILKRTQTPLEHMQTQND